jgi:hypothetical protein
MSAIRFDDVEALRAEIREARGPIAHGFPRRAPLPRGMRVASEIAIHGVGSERPALTYESRMPYGPSRA